jgi:hypothetical protein
MTKDEALDLALEALIDASGHVNNETFVKVMMARDAINDTIKQARSAPTVQEPVAWLQIGLAPFHDGDVIARTTKPKAWNPEWWRFEPLYTTPPAAQRQWVGLTDDEIFSVLGNLQRKYNGPLTEDSRVVFALAIEAKLKEKNNG